MSSYLPDLPNHVLKDFLATFCVELIGEGSGRRVYALSTDPTKVVKIEAGGVSFQNVTEWQTWQDLAHTRYAKYLAPCHRISPCGIVLIQSRVMPLQPQQEVVKLPSFLNDFQRANYGILEGRVVCADYGTNLLLNHGAFSSKLKQPEWRG